MSFWYDSKQKSYADDTKGSWIRSYVDKMVSVLRNEKTLSLDQHQKGELYRHNADAIDCDNGLTVQENLSLETSERILADTSLRDEFTGADTRLETYIEGISDRLSQRIATEEETRQATDSELQGLIQSEAEQREYGLSLKVDKETGKGLSSNDFTDGEKAKLSQIQDGAEVNVVTSVAGRVGDIVLDKADVGLSNIDNTADIDKPISSATQSALSSKVNISEFVSGMVTKADRTEVLSKTNEEEFVPSGNYQPATKKYVDDSISSAGGGDMLKNVYDADNDGVVDNAKKLGGELPSYYATKSEVNAKAPINHLSSGTSYGVGNSSSYGHLKLADNLTTTASGTALSANQGKALNTKITNLEDSVSAMREYPPTLSPVTPDGTMVGASAWTGTGYYCIATGTKYTVSNSNNGFDKVFGFNRFCLKPLDPDSARGWTPYLTYNGNTYEFFYSLSRELYETLIPDMSLNASEIVSLISWKHYAPKILTYGKPSNFLSYTEVTGENNSVVKHYTVKSKNFRMKDHCFVTKEDSDIILGLWVGSYGNKLNVLSTKEQAMCFLMLDTNGRTGLVDMGDASNLYSLLSKTMDLLPIESIDNDFSGLV